MPNFTLSSQQCELLILIRQYPSLSAIAGALKKDVSVVSRQVQELSNSHQVLFKQGRGWQLTEYGRRVCDWAEKAIHDLRLLSGVRKKIRIASTREFGARMLAPMIQKVYPLEKYDVELISSDYGIEDLLKQGVADFGFDCDRPYDPKVKFRWAIPERMVIAYSVDFLDKKSKNIEEFCLKNSEHYIHNARNSLETVFDLTANRITPKLTAHDISTVREAIIAGNGWSMLPYYAVQKEHLEKKLTIADHPKLEKLKYGVWWLKDKNIFQTEINHAIDWLKTVKMV